MTGSRRSCFFILPNFMPFLLLLFLISLLLLHGGASSVEATTTACSNRTKAGDCVSVANRRIEDEDEAPAGAGQFLDSLGQVAHFTYGALKPPPKMMMMTGSRSEKLLLHGFSCYADSDITASYPRRASRDDNIKDSGELMKVEEDLAYDQEAASSWLFHVMLFLISLLLPHGAPVETTTSTAAASCSNGTAAGDCVSPANCRIEDEDEDAPGRE
nr:hypothetical protein Iba_chr11cCG8170 [Ipomoea batatas]